jgi:hypothetical protein
MTDGLVYRVTTIDRRGARDVFQTGDSALADAWKRMRAAQGAEAIVVVLTSKASAPDPAEQRAGGPSAGRVAQAPAARVPRNGGRCGREDD